jgi:hypothetical protein
MWRDIIQFSDDLCKHQMWLVSDSQLSTCFLLLSLRSLLKMPEIPPCSVHKHPEFFFSDGNIVLVAGAEPTLAFRLHRGIVNRWSPVFRGMITALEVASDPWSFLGCSVLVFDDDPVDFERLIRVLCDGTYVLVASIH